MNYVQQNGHAARLAIPDPGYDWPDHKLKTLGLEVQAQYPELANWPPYLAAEAHLYYAGRFPSNPANVEARSVEFLAFLRTGIAGHVSESSAVGAHS